MKVTLILVSSVDGCTTRGLEPAYHWASAEDQKFFFEQINEHTLIVMGRETYQSSRSMIRLQPGKQRVVVTSTPEKYVHEEVEGQLSFTNAQPAELTKKYAQAGYAQMLLVGGAQLAGSFLAAGLIDEIFLTVEPRAFGSGRPLFEGVLPRSTHLKLLSARQLNAQGTLLTKYQVLR
ncbi:MAG TPA: dihydrofolate reductase family protein [Vitreimonas sp.]|nr:dihydrofolate reductase family protein [Vitreimonas sp.]